MREGMDSETWVTRESALSMRGPGQPEEEAPSPGGVCDCWSSAVHKALLRAITLGAHMGMGAPVA
jgi:hypothetical protein